MRSAPSRAVHHGADDVRVVGLQLGRPVSLRPRRKSCHGRRRSGVADDGADAAGVGAAIGRRCVDDGGVEIAQTHGHHFLEAFAAEQFLGFAAAPPAREPTDLAGCRR